jgi:hypothetical protein
MPLDKEQELAARFPEYTARFGVERPATVDHVA